MFLSVPIIVVFFLAGYFEPIRTHCKRPLKSVAGKMCQLSVSRMNNERGHSRERY